MPQPPKVPAHLAKLYVEKPGFTNYHFNELERDRTLKGLAGFGDYSQETGTWKLAALLATTGHVQPGPRHLATIRSHVDASA